MAGQRGRTHHTKVIELIGWSGTVAELAARMRISEEDLLDRLTLAGIDTTRFPIRVQCHVSNPQPLFQALWRKVETTDTVSGWEYRCWVNVSY